MSEQRILFGRDERLYREYKDSTGTLVDPTWTRVTVYDPNGTFLSSGAATKESTGVYYYNVSLSTATTTKEGTYQAYWEGTIGGVLVTMDVPQYFDGYKVPWQITQPDQIINSVRRMIGDISPENYRVSTRDMYWFLKDAVDEVQAEYDFGYTLTITSTSVSWNSTLYTAPFTLFKLKTLILVMESTLNDFMYHAGNVEVGDIRVNVTNILRARMDNLKRLQEKYERIMYEIKANGINGFVIDTYIRNQIINDYNYAEYVYE